MEIRGFMKTIIMCDSCSESVTSFTRLLAKNDSEQITQENMSYVPLRIDICDNCFSGMKEKGILTFAQFSDLKKLVAYSRVPDLVAKKKPHKIKIVSDGSAAGTRVYAGSVEILGITHIDIDAINTDSCLTSVAIKFVDVDLDIECVIKNPKGEP